ncbi:MAG TPA: SRPBCC domain-containing protein [Puia sp.]|nr:SRPBCC domain-containing protein [Puia sp.]
MNRTIQHTIFYAHAPEIVWNYLTQSELMAEWLMENDFRPQPGHEFQFRIRPIPDFEFDGIVHCKVLEIIPHKRLSYSWKGGPGDGKINMDSVVTWTLTAKEGGTEVSLIHSGFIENQGIFNSMREGWLKNMRKIAALISPGIQSDSKG